MQYIVQLQIRITNNFFWISYISGIHCTSRRKKTRNSRRKREEQNQEWGTGSCILRQRFQTPRRNVHDEDMCFSFCESYEDNDIESQCLGHRRSTVAIRSNAPDWPASGTAEGIPRNPSRRRTTMIDSDTLEREINWNHTEWFLRKHFFNFQFTIFFIYHFFLRQFNLLTYVHEICILD